MIVQPRLPELRAKDVHAVVGGKPRPLRGACLLRLLLICARMPMHASGQGRAGFAKCCALPIPLGKTRIALV